MMAISGAERVRQHRLRKEAEQFGSDYMGGAIAASPDEFIEAKADESVTQTTGAENVQFHLSFTLLFTDRLMGEYDADDGRYSIEDMIDAWKWAEKELEA